PRVASLAAILLDESGTETDMMDTLVYPDGWEMPARLTDIHGISQEDLLATGKPITEVVQTFSGLIDHCDIMVAYGIQFDIAMISGEWMRAKMPAKAPTKPK